MNIGQRSIGEIKREVATLEAEAPALGSRVNIFLWPREIHTLAEDGEEFETVPLTESEQSDETPADVPRDDSQPFPIELSGDLQDIVSVDRRWRYGSSGVEIFTREDAGDLYDRLETALTESSLDVDIEAYVGYLGARARGDLPEGKEGVREHFEASVGVDAVNRVFRNAVEARV